MSGVPNPERMRIDSLEPEGRTRFGFMSGRQVSDPLSLLALGVNGVHLDLDHGYPARVIVPASVGNRNLKWVHRLTFMEA